MVKFDRFIKNEMELILEERNKKIAELEKQIRLHQDELYKTTTQLNATRKKETK